MKLYEEHIKKLEVFFRIRKEGVTGSASTCEVLFIDSTLLLEAMDSAMDSCFF